MDLGSFLLARGSKIPFGRFQIVPFGPRWLGQGLPSPKHHPHNEREPTRKKQNRALVACSSGHVKLDSYRMRYPEVRSAQGRIRGLEFLLQDSACDKNLV